MRNLLSIKGDLTGGITAGIIALPLALAFGIASGLGAIAGLYGAIILCFFASIFGGTKTQISGPTGPMTVVVATVALVLHDIRLIVAVFVLAGIFQILLGILKVGKFFKVIPYPVISGFMSGVGVIIIILQISPLLGSDSSSTILGALYLLFDNIKNTNLQSAMLGFASLAIIFFTPKKISSFVPSQLIALIILTIVSMKLNLDVKTIGEIPSAIPSFIMPDFDFHKASLITSYAAMLAVLGSIDSLLTSLVADSITKTKHNPNKELIGQGIGNIFCGIFGGMVGAGATMRTVTNIKTGGNSRLSGVISSLFLVLVLFVLSGFVSNVPLSVLSGILIKVGFDILDYRLLKNMKNAPTHDLIVMIVVFALTVFVDLIFAVGIGIVASSLLLVHRISKETEVKLFEDENDDGLNTMKNGIRIITINGAFFFGSTSQIVDRASSLMDLNIIIIDSSKVPFIDLSGAYALEEMIDAQKEKGILVYLVLNEKHLHDKTLKQVIKLVGNANVFTKRKEAIVEAVKLNKTLSSES